MTASKWQCPAGHLSWSPRKLDGCPHGGCDEKVECVAGPAAMRALLDELAA